MTWKTFSRILLVLPLLLCFYAARPAQAAWQPELAIGLRQGASSITITPAQQCQLFLDASEKPFRSVKAGVTLTFSSQGGKLTLDGKQLPGTSLTVRAERPASARFSTAGSSYRGAAKVMLRGSALTLVNLVQTEDYLKGVVPEEMPPEWPQQAVKAQSVAARTFALKNRKRHQGEGFDLCATTHCQVYEGIAAEKAASTATVDATYGEVLFYQGALIDALFHTDSGGMTENSEDVWGTKLPYLRAATETKTYTQPWQKIMSADELADKIESSSHKPLGKLKKIELPPIVFGKRAAGRTASGRVKSVTFIGSNGRASVSGNKLREMLGLRSTLFEMKITGSLVTISGYGWGHGLGLSQWGAKEWAASKDYKGILAHYYHGTTLKQLYKK